MLLGRKCHVDQSSEMNCLGLKTASLSDTHAHYYSALCSSCVNPARCGWMSSSLVHPSEGLRGLVSATCARSLAHVGYSQTKSLFVSCWYLLPEILAVLKLLVVLSGFLSRVRCCGRGLLVECGTFALVARSPMRVASAVQ